MTDSQAQNSADRIAIGDVMLRYAAGVDERDFDLYRSAFADDVEVVDFGPEPTHGAQAWVEYVIGALQDYRDTQHMLGPTYAEIDGDVAQTRTDVQALHCFKDSEKPNLTLWATYKTQMKRINGEWKITHHRLVRRDMRMA